MTNVLPLSIPSAAKIDGVKNSTKADQALMSVLNTFEQWRKNKKTSAEAIPDELCRQIFALESYYSAGKLRRCFGLSTRQYHSKREKYFPTHIKPAVEETSKQKPAAEMTPPLSPPKLCEIKIIPANPYTPDPLPSAKTLVVEFCRSDGRIMKIHTTQDSIPTLMHTFFGEH